MKKYEDGEDCESMNENIDALETLELSNLTEDLYVEDIERKIRWENIFVCE